MTNLELKIEKTFNTKKELLNSQELVNAFNCYEHLLDSNKEEIKRLDFVNAFNVIDPRYDVMRIVVVFMKNDARYFEFIDSCGACVKANYDFCLWEIINNKIICKNIHFDTNNTMLAKFSKIDNMVWN